MTATATRERPILFSGPMVRAILEGRKTQARRVVSLSRVGFFPSWVGWLDDRDNGSGWYALDVDQPYGEPAECWGEKRLSCPYGEPGDRLWVRETWAHGVTGPVYRSDYDVSDGFGSHVVDLATGETVPLLWRPSIHMKREHSRITLRVESVRVERVLKITEADAVAEGFGADNISRVGIPAFSAQGRFRELWDKLNGPRGFGWDANPWVWVVTFSRVGPDTRPA